MKTSPLEYRVKKGDTLSEIAADFGKKTEDIAKLNDIDNPHHIEEGAVLKIE